MKKKIIALVLCLTMVAASLTAGCGKKDSNETLVIEIYDEAANFQGTQVGWFAKVVKDRFNIELNIIAPQVAGEAIYQTRTTAGNLGDIVLLDPTHFNDCVDAGLIKDISKEIKGCENLMKFEKQITTRNNSIPGNDKGAIYGIPCEMMDTSPTSVTAERIYSLPQLSWDLYNKIGAPKLNNLDDLLDVFVKIRKIHPTNEKGDPAYPLSLWPDWDGGDGMIGIANVVQINTWYGEKIKGSAILKEDGKTFYPLTDATGTYYKMLQFLNKGYRMGVVDPDSGTQDWNSV